MQHGMLVNMETQLLVTIALPKHLLGRLRDAQKASKSNAVRQLSLRRFVALLLDEALGQEDA